MRVRARRSCCCTRRCTTDRLRAGHRGTRDRPAGARTRLAWKWRVSPARHPAARRRNSAICSSNSPTAGSGQRRGRRQLGGRIRRLPAGAGATRSHRGRRARQHQRLHAAQRFHSVLLRADGTSRGHQSGVPGFRACVHAAKNPTDKAVVDRVVAPAESHEGARTAAALWKSFTEPGHDLRTRAAQISAPVLITWGAKDVTARRDGVRPYRRGHSGVRIRAAADGSCHLLVGAGGVAGNGPAVRRRGARGARRAPQLSVTVRADVIVDGESATGRGESELIMAISRPASPDLRRVAIGRPVPARAVADPHRRRPGVRRAAGLAAARGDCHEKAPAG